jgi:cell division protein ZapA (FtsZ GTPase activity inhibitor)
MAENERLVEFELLGQEFKFYTAASEEEMQRILSLVRKLVELEPGRSKGTLPVGKVAVLACLNIASRLVKQEDEYENYRRETEERMVKLCDSIRSELVDDPNRA